MSVGLSDNVFYWRDKTGNEVDVVIDTARKMITIKAKLGETIGTDFFKGLAYFYEIFPSIQKKIVV